MSRFLLFFVNFLMLVCLACQSHAAVKARYVRLDNPTGFAMEWRQMEIYSGGVNILRDHPEWVTGTNHPERENTQPTRENTVIADSRPARDLVNGDTDVSHRASEWVAFRQPGQEQCWNPWFEVDLGREVEIEKIVLYGSRYPHRFYLDKGHRTLVTLDAARRVNWGTRWQYYDAKTWPGGVFAFTPSASDGKNQENAAVIGRVVPERAPDWVPMSWILPAEEEALPPEAETRMARFARRNSPAEIKKLAEEFFTILDENAPGLESAFQEYRAGNYQAALDAWKVYWFGKMVAVNQHQALGGRASYSANGDDLMAGLMVTIMANDARAIRFTPGRIHWIQVPEDKDAPDYRKRFFEAWADTERKACAGSVCWPLLDAYRENPRPEYVARWAEIMDDWGMNYFQDAQGVKWEVENLFTFNPCHEWCQMMEDLAETAAAHPDFVAHMPSATLARTQMMALEKYSTAWWRQARETVFNHNNSGYYAWEPVLKYIQEFHPGQRAARMWRECLERMLVLGNFRDGSMTEIGDEGHMEIPIILNLTMSRLEADPPAWMTPGWRNHYFEWNDKMFTHMFRHLAPGGYEHRDRPDYRPYRWTSTWKPYFAGRPSVAIDRDEAIFGIPEVRRMIGVWQNERKTEKKTVEQPEILSDWMPYTGSYYFRGGWTADAPFLAMLAGRADGGSEPWLYPYGWVYAYDHNFPLITSLPVHVNGNPPYRIHGKENRWKPGTKTSYLVNADENPADYRWVSTPRLDFGETVHEGAYGRFPDFRGDWDDTSLRMAPLREVVDGVRAERQIIHLRGPQLFIVADRIKTRDGKKYEFSIPYKPALSVKSAEKNAEGFKAESQLGILQYNDEPKTRAIMQTKNPDGPNMTLRQFADTPFRFELHREEKPNFGRYACRLGGEIGIAEPTVRMVAEAENMTTIALMESILAGSESRIHHISQEPADTDDPAGAETLGFYADTDDEYTIIFEMSRSGKPVYMYNGRITACAEMLCMVSTPSDGVYGFALGCESFEVWQNLREKTRIAMPYHDFEFKLGAGTIVHTTPILRPIKPVTFTPDRDVFAGSETVRMMSETPGVEIRYTLDGTPPGRDSLLYTGPITITDTTEIAARAYRLQPDGTPWPAVGEDFEVNGTHFTVPSYAFYRKETPREPVSVSRENLTPGLNYEYLEDHWWRLFASGHWLPAQRTGVAAREMDLSEVATKSAYMMRYKGYLDIPRDGVYTFHAPEEMVKMIAATSYDLRLYVDGEEWRTSQFWHAQGTWSIPLKAGLHRFQLDFADARVKPWHRTGIWRFYPRPWAEFTGPPSPLFITGPGLDRQRIPEAFFLREKN